MTIEDHDVRFFRMCSMSEMLVLYIMRSEMTRCLTLKRTQMHIDRRKKD